MVLLAAGLTSVVIIVVYGSIPVMSWLAEPEARPTSSPFLVHVPEPLGVILVVVPVVVGWCARQLTRLSWWRRGATDLTMTLD